MEEILKTIPSRMNAEEAEPELANENSALVVAPRAQLSELRVQIREQSRRLRELEMQLRAVTTPAPQQLALGIGSPARVTNSSHSGGRLERIVNYSPFRPRTRSAEEEEANGTPLSGRKRPEPRGSNNSQLSTAMNKDTDPYTHMFASSRFKHERIFDQELLMAIYEKPYQRMRHQAALFTSGIMGLLSMPFGPIGMVGGALMGALIGAILGAIMDMRTLKAKFQDSELEKKRLKSLLRWASERHTEDDEILSLIEMVTLEFKPIADIAPKSNNARKLLKLLDGWIGKKLVTRQIWVYMEQLLLSWRTLPRDQLLRSMLVLQTLTTMYHFSSRALDDLELQFVRRMERLLAHESVQSVINHAQQNVSVGETRLMESLVYADALSAMSPTRCRLPAGDVEAGQTEDAADLQDNIVSDDSGDERCRVRTPISGISPSARSLRTPRESTASPAYGSNRRKKVLKKPFFRGWEDFMDFDDTIKHKMPITLCEFDLLLEKEAEDTKNWDVCVERKDLRIAKVMCGPGMITIRAWATFPGVDVHTAFYLFYNLDERTKWDKTFCKMGVTDSNLQGSDVVYCVMKIPTVTTRDFLQYRRVRVLEDGSILIMLRSADHPDMPEVNGYIRVENKISGYILRQAYEDGKPILKMFLMTCSDVKGMIPKWIINYLAPKKPAEWMDALRKAAMDYQAAHPGKNENVLALLRSFEAENAWDFEPEATSSDLEDNSPDPRSPDGENGANPTSAVNTPTSAGKGRVAL